MGRKTLVAVAALVLFVVGTTACVLTDQCSYTDGSVDLESNSRFIIDLFLDQLSR